MLWVFHTDVDNFLIARVVMANLFEPQVPKLEGGTQWVAAEPEVVAEGRNPRHGGALRPHSGSTASTSCSGSWPTACQSASTMAAAASSGLAAGMGGE